MMKAVKWYGKKDILAKGFDELVNNKDNNIKIIVSPS